MKSAPEIRAQVVAFRRSLTPEDLQRRSALMIEKFFADPPPGARGSIYLPLQGEPAIHPLIERLYRQGTELFVPRVIGSIGLGKMEMARFDPENPAGPGSAIAPEELDWILVPGVAFGPDGQRIGRGAGFYDRFLPRAPQAHRIALAMDEQIFDDLPQNTWDQRVHRILTETRDLRPKRA